VTSALPWMTLASGAEIRSLDGSGDSRWSVRPGDGQAAPGGSRDEGHRQVCSARNLWHAAHGSDGPGQRASDDGGPAPLSIDGVWAWSTISGGIRWWQQHQVSINGSKLWQMNGRRGTVGPATPINRMVRWGSRDAPDRLAWLEHAPGRGASPVHYFSMLIHSLGGACAHYKYIYRVVIFITYVMITHSKMADQNVNHFVIFCQLLYTNLY
jgi:hypothetical protein